MKRSSVFAVRCLKLVACLVVLCFPLLSASADDDTGKAASFRLEEATIQSIHAAYKSGQLTSHRLVQLYLDRIEAYDKNGPQINSVITLNPDALAEADKLDAAFKKSGFVGPLHGIPIVVKDMADAKGMPTTMGSLALKDYYPQRDSFVVERLKKAGAIILGKTTLGEFAGGDTYGSLFGATRNPYDPKRTVGGSSGGSGAALAANLTAVAVGQENVSSTRRPAAWNAVVGLRPSTGLVSRSGVDDGWPGDNGTLTPMARTVTDLAILFDSMVGYDSEDPLTAKGVGHIPSTYMKFLDRNGLKGARIGVLRSPMYRNPDPDTPEVHEVTATFDKALAELKSAGAVIVDPIEIPKLAELIATRVRMAGEEQSFAVWFNRGTNPPYKSRQDLVNSPSFVKIFPGTQQRLRDSYAPTTEEQLRYLLAKDELMTSYLKVMADNKLDAIVYKSMAGPPALIKDGPVPTSAGGVAAPAFNSFLIYVPAISVPSSFTASNLPTGITFQGRPYDEGEMIKLAYAYEQATHHRKPPVMKTGSQ